MVLVYLIYLINKFNSFRIDWGVWYFKKYIVLMILLFKFWIKTIGLLINYVSIFWFGNIIYMFRV